MNFLPGRAVRVSVLLKKNRNRGDAIGLLDLLPARKIAHGRERRERNAGPRTTSDHAGSPKGIAGCRAHSVRG